MAIGKLALLIITITALLRVMPLSTAIDGTASYYSPPYVPSACYGNQDQGERIAAASDTLWDNGAACGRRYSVSCTGGTNNGVRQPCWGDSIGVTIVDYCSDCGATINLSIEAFTEIANPNAGKITIDYHQV